MRATNRFLRCITEYIILFFVYGGIYFLIECIWKREISDIRMFMLGGGISVFLGLLNNIFDYDTDFLLQCFMGMMIVVLAESILGYRWNVVEGLGIWDYNDLRFSGVDGQVNLYFALAWFFLSGILIILDDAINYYILGFKPDTPPYYCALGHLLFKMKPKKCRKGSY